MTDEEIKKAFITCLTDTSWDGCVNCSYHEHYPNKCKFLLQKDGFYLIKRLEAKNAELRERLEKAVELPCKVGDTVYWVFGTMIYEHKVDGFTFNTDDRYGLRLILGETAPSVMYYKGIKLFFDRSEAEARLAEIKGE